MPSVRACIAIVVVVALASAGVAAAGPDASTTPATDPTASVLARVPVTAGPVPGEPGLTVRSATDATHCGGLDVTVRLTRGKVPAADRDFAAAMLIDAPRGLDMDPAHKPRRDAAMKKFNAFIEDATKKMAAANARYEHIAGDTSAQPEDRVIAAARIAQINRRYAEILARMEIPRALRSGPYAADTTAAFCDALAVQAAPLLDKADEAATVCRDRAANVSLPASWWTPVCAAPATPAP